MAYVKEGTKRPQTRPKFTKEFLQIVLDDIANDAPAKYATSSNGMSESHFYHMIQQGVIDQRLERKDTLDAWLVQSLHAIHKQKISDCLKDIRNSDKGHKGAEWILERCFWRQFSASASVLELAEEIDSLKDKGVATDELKERLDSGRSESREQGKAKKKARRKEG
jgi:hypothetical protein